MIDSDEKLWMNRYLIHLNVINTKLLLKFVVGARLVVTKYVLNKSLLFVVVVPNAYFFIKKIETGATNRDWLLLCRGYFWFMAESIFCCSASKFRNSVIVVINEDTKILNIAQTDI